MKQIISFIAFLSCISFATGQSNCGNAVAVLLNSVTTAPAFTTETGTPPTAFCGLNNNNQNPTKGKWYKFIATQNINITVTTLLAQNNNSDTRLIIYSGDCTALVCVGSNDDFNGSNSSEVTFAATSGTLYTLAFDNRFSNAAFDFKVMEAIPPAPDRLSFTSTPISGITGGYNNCITDMNGDFLDDIVSAVSTTQLAITYQGANGVFTTTAYPLTNTSVLPSWSILNHIQKTRNIGS
jgi:hypothetical protein